MTRRLTSLWIALLGLASPALAEPNAVPTVSAGRIVDLGVLTSRTSDPRRVVVWLPSGYRADGPRYSVLYMHDGQNLFDKATAGYGMEWGIDETLDRLIREHKVRPTIVVGIWNTPKRLQEYVPRKVFAALPPAYMDRVRGLYGGDPLSDAYLKFIVRELKPRIDRRFHVATGPRDTVIMGSSMGSLISLYAIDEYPRVFGAAGMMSTHWPQFAKVGEAKLTDAEMAIAEGSFLTYLRSGLASPVGHRLYFDDGAEQDDRQYAGYKILVDGVVAARGYRKDVNWMSRNFPGQPHNENSWASRVEIPLRFLLPPRNSGTR